MPKFASVVDVPQGSQWCFTHNAWCGTDPPTLAPDETVHCSRHTHICCAKCERFLKSNTKHYIVEGTVTHVDPRCYRELVKRMPSKKR